MKIRGNTVGTTTPKPNINQTDPKKGDYLLIFFIIALFMNNYIIGENVLNVHQIAFTFQFFFVKNGPSKSLFPFSVPECPEHSFGTH